MRRRLLFSAGVVGAATIGLLSVASTGWTAPDYETGAYLFVALVVVGVFDVWLPRGDYIEMGGALAFASCLLLSPLFAAVMSASARLLVWATRPRREELWRVLDDVAKRVALMSWALALFMLLGGRGEGLVARSRYQLVPTLAAAGLFFVLDFAITQLGSSVRLGTPYIPLLLGNLRLQGWLGAAQASAAILAVATYWNMRALAVVIVVGLLSVMRQSFSLLVDVRQAYRSTIEALARAIEAQDPLRRGHAERVAALSTEVGRVLGRHGKTLEALTYAALFHDVGRLDAADPGPGATGSADVLANVGFLVSSVPVLRIMDARGETETSQRAEDLVAAYVVSHMCEYDDESQGLTASGDARLSEAIGARLYSDTRRSVDRAIQRVERRAEAGRLSFERAATDQAIW